MIKFAAAAGPLGERRAVHLVSAAIKRAGADPIITCSAEAPADSL